MKSTVSLLSVFSFLALFAQEAPEIEWSKTFGDSREEYAHSIKETSDGGFVVVGSSNSFLNNSDWNASDYWIVKLDSNGNVDWEKNYGGSGHDVASSVLLASDGGYLIAGSSNSKDGDVSNPYGTHDYDGWLIKLNEVGELEWEKSIGGSDGDEIRAMTTSNDNSILLVGRSFSSDGLVSSNYGMGDIWAIKLDEFGNFIWEKNFGGSGDDSAFSVLNTNEGGYLIGGYTESVDGDITEHYGMRDLFIIKINSLGNLEWKKTFGGTDWDELKGICQTSNGDIGLVGFTYSEDHWISENNGDSDVWVIKLTESGEFLWENTYGSTGTEEGYTILAMQDGGFLIGGFSDETVDGDVTESFGSIDGWLIRTDDVGNLVWQKSMGGNWADSFYSLINTSGNGYAVAGYYEFENPTGQPEDINIDYWVLKLGPDQMSNSEINSNQISIYPNPVKDILNFSEELQNIKIHALTGQKVAQKTSGNSIKVNQLSSGTYVLTAENENGQKVSLKFIKK